MGTNRGIEDVVSAMVRVGMEHEKSKKVGVRVAGEKGFGRVWGGRCGFGDQLLAFGEAQDTRQPERTDHRRWQS